MSAEWLRILNINNVIPGSKEFDKLYVCLLHFKKERENAVFGAHQPSHAPPQLATRYSKREGELDLVITDCKKYHSNKY